MTEQPIQIGSPLRDAATDPQPDDLAPMRQVRGAPAGVLKHAEVGEPEYYAAVAARRAADN